MPHGGLAAGCTSEARRGVAMPLSSVGRLARPATDPTADAAAAAGAGEGAGAGAGAGARACVSAAGAEPGMGGVVAVAVVVVVAEVDGLEEEARLG